MTEYEIGDYGDAEIETLLGELTNDDVARSDLPGGLWERISAEAMGPATFAPENGRVVEVEPSRRNTRRLAFVAAAAVLVVALVVGGLVAQRNGSDSTVVAQAELTYDPNAFDPVGATASAEVSLVDVDGRFSVEFDDSDLPQLSSDAEDLELWLIEPDDQGNPVGLVSLGVIDPDTPGAFDVPADYDPATFFVVDISVEPRDGNTSHSGRSILRGLLTGL